MQHKLILGLETSWDESPAALVTDHGGIRWNIVSSQGDQQAPYGRGGPEAVLTRLDPRIRWRAPVLEIEKHIEAAVEPGGRGLLLVPVVFGKAAAYVSLDGPWPPTVAYTPRGAGALCSLRFLRFVWPKCQARSPTPSRSSASLV